jgi:hypothetical protein
MRLAVNDFEIILATDRFSNKYTHECLRRTDDHDKIELIDFLQSRGARVVNQEPEGQVFWIDLGIDWSQYDVGDWFVFGIDTGGYSLSNEEFIERFIKEDNATSSKTERRQHPEDRPEQGFEAGALDETNRLLSFLRYK